ncbi:MAG: hypothetical protein CM15mP66_05490 [Pseudomonadota bacterium]|nr:MAG: hypothetical protein CM15mP66_05490 [Pseudomonadota bacterium]
MEEEQKRTYSKYVEAPNFWKVKYEKKFEKVFVEAEEKHGI